MAWRAIAFIGVLLIVSFTATVALEAAWLSGGNLVCGAAYYQYEVTAVSDGAGGVIVAWMDNRNAGDANIYAQKISASGEMQWTANGVAVCTASGDQRFPVLVPDGSGGVIVVWDDERTDSDIYAQRISAAGAVLWTANGVAISTAMYGQESPKAVSDGAGGAIITWEDWRTDANIYAQRVSAAGAVLWTANGVAVCAAASSDRQPEIAPDGAGGAIIVWYNDSGGTSMDIYAQRISAAGTPLWNTNGNAVCANSSIQYSPAIASDAVGGAVIGWMDLRSTNSTVYAQRVTPGGAPRWTADGIPVFSGTFSGDGQHMISDGQGGAFCSMLEEEYIGWVNLHAQRVDSTGLARWGSAGLTMREGTVYPGKHALVADGTGGLFVVWGDVRTGGDIYAQRIDAGGTALWDAGGIGVCTRSAFQLEPAAAAAGLGGMIIAWPDDRNMSDMDIYAQGVSRTGGSLDLWPTITAALDVPRDQGGKLALQWAASPADVYPGVEITHYSVWRRLPGSLPYALEGEGAMVRVIAGASGYAWEWIANVPAKHYEEYALMVTSRYDSMGTDPGWQYFVVSAHTGDPLLYYDSPVDSGYSVDNLSPVAPAGLAGEQSYAPAGLVLNWSANAESDLGGYAVYRGTSEDFVPGPENLVATPVDPGWVDDEWTWDGGYCYKVAAVDVHGNESGYAILRAEDVTGTETPAAPRASYLGQNYPNPFNPSTRIVFGLAAPSPVSLRIYDAAGHLVRVLIEGTKPAGNYSEAWNGLDASGRAAASGIYFYRLTAGAFTETRKMVLLR